MNNIFYVYEHIRNDNNHIFYVGKGKENRAYNKSSRNTYWKNVVKKSNGFTVRFILTNINEELALLCEEEVISSYKRKGIKLTNITSGGEGVSGLKHSEITKSILREKRSHQVIVITKETKIKIGLANSISLKGRKNPEHSIRMTGRKQTDETIGKRACQLRGKSRSPEAIMAITNGLKGKKSNFSSKRKYVKSTFRS